MIIRFLKYCLLSELPSSAFMDVVILVFFIYLNILMPHSILDGCVTRTGSLPEYSPQVGGGLLVRGPQSHLLAHDSQGPVHVQLYHPGMHSK